MRVLVCLALLVAPVYAGEKATCTSDAECKAPLTCVRTNKASKARCELACNDKTKCPEDQRCVSDHGTRVCRPIVDGVDL